MTPPKTYRASMVSEVLGIKPTTLRQWHARGVYEVETREMREWFEMGAELGNPQAGPVREFIQRVSQAEALGWRLYTFADMVRLAIVVRLSEKHSVSIERAGQIATRCYVQDSLDDMRTIYTDLPENDTASRRNSEQAMLVCEPEVAGAHERSEEWELDRCCHNIPVDSVGKTLSHRFAKDDIRRPMWRNETAIFVNVAKIAEAVRERLTEVEAK